MTREQVIKGFEVCSDLFGNCYDCPYMANGGDPEQCDRQAFKDALALLKEQEPIPVKRIDGKHNHFIKCGNCNIDLMSGMKYCPQCGRAVKWDADISR